MKIGDMVWCIYLVSPFEGSNDLLQEIWSTEELANERFAELVESMGSKWLKFYVEAVTLDEKRA